MAKKKKTQVIYVKPDGRLGSDPSDMAQLPGFTHFLVPRSAMKRVNNHLLMLDDAIMDAHENEDGHLVGEINAETSGILETLKNLRLPCP